MESQAELREVKLELDTIEQQLQELLERQSQLLAKKSRLEQALKEEAAAEASQDWTRTDFPWSKELVEKRERIFKINTFRPLQLQTMNATLSGKDCILIMPTGGGKSLCFQLPALIGKGLTLVISPLVSLMEDQLYSLQQLDVEAALLNASCSKEEVNRVQADMTSKNGSIRLLYVTPEKLAKSKRFMNKLEKCYELGRLSRLVIDEVHCCSQWGHDFRPDYKFLGIMKQQFPRVPILGLTATATSHVLQDVRKILQIQGCLTFRASFNRTNLFYEVRSKPSSQKEQMDEMQKIIDSRFSGKSGIVYCFSQKDTEEVTRELQSRGIKAGVYHANLDAKYRSDVHKRWIKNSLQVVVATIAFGMGIDKPDVRFVIHHSVSKSMENYYQESGRAGRDDEKSYCILFASFGDIFRQSTMVFTEQTGLEKLYGMVNYGFDISKCRRTMIARHFGERWDRAQCNKMCDHCQSGTKESNKQNISGYVKDLVAILANCKKKQTRVTGLKLLDTWMWKGNVPLRLAHIKAPKLSREMAERILIHLLVSGYLREDFHFTAYSTISYIVVGPKANLLNSGDHTVEMEFPVTKSAASATVSKAPGPKSEREKDRKKVKPVVINPQNSKFSTMVGNGDPEQSPKVVKSNSNVKTKKRKVAAIDSSDSDLDFGETGDGPKKRKAKTVKLSQNNSQNSVLSKEKKKGCIVIESDENSDFEVSSISKKSSNSSQHKNAKHSNSNQDESSNCKDSDDKRVVLINGTETEKRKTEALDLTGEDNSLDRMIEDEEDLEREYMLQLQNADWSD